MFAWFGFGAQELIVLGLIALAGVVVVAVILFAVSRRASGIRPPAVDPCTKGLTPVQAFGSEAIRVQPGTQLEPRLGRPARSTGANDLPPHPAWGATDSAAPH
jgi:hypothetical protein